VAERPWAVVSLSFWRFISVLSGAFFVQALFGRPELPGLEPAVSSFDRLMVRWGT
jgi:hypothetical protein